MRRNFPFALGWSSVRCGARKIARVRGPRGRHRVRGQSRAGLTMRLRSHVRSAVKTASWRAFAAVDTFALVWLFSGHDATHAIAAAGAMVGVEAITKSFLYFAHERLWEAPAFSTRRGNGAHAHHFQSVEA